MKKVLYPERNRLFLVLSVIMSISVLVIARYSTLPALPGFQFLVGAVPEDTIPYDIAMGYLASYVFYLIQVFIPQRNRERKSLKSLECYLKAYLRNAQLFYAVLQDYEFTKLHECAGEIPEYIYRNKAGEVIREKFAPPNQQNEDGIYNFLLKTNNLYKHIIENPAFSSLDVFLIDQIQAINMPYWFESYESIIALVESELRNRIRSFRNDEDQKELLIKMRDAINVMDEYLEIGGIVEKCL